jgi:hypothetical protein
MFTLKPSQWLDTTDPNVIRILRFTFGVTLSVAASFAFAWPLFFVTPIFVAKFLGSPAPCPDFRAGLVVTLVIGLGCGVGLAVTYFTIHYPVVCLLTISILLFHIFYANVRGVSPLVVAFLLIGITAIPLMGAVSFSLATSITSGLMLSGGLAFVFVWIAHGFIPDSVTEASKAAAPVAHPPMGDREQIRSAAISTLVVLPVIAIFFMFQMTDMLLVMIFIAMLAQTPDVKTGAKGSAALVIGNTAGGVAAILFYNLLVAVPSFVFLILLTLLFSLFFGERLFSGKPMTGLYATAFSTVILLVGSTTGHMGGDAVSKFYTRIAQIILAGAYIVGAFYLLEIISRQKRKHEAYEQSRVVDDIDVI